MTIAIRRKADQRHLAGGSRPTLSRHASARRRDCAPRLAGVNGALALAPDLIFVAGQERATSAPCAALRLF